MEQCDISLASLSATADQVDAIKRRSASCNIGTICVPWNFAHPVNNDHAIRRFKWLRNLFDFIRKDCD
jgi:hypothetical protein